MSSTPKKSPLRLKPLTLWIPPRSIMPLINGLFRRDSHIYDANDSNAALGSLVLTPGVTNANLCLITKTVSICTSTFYLQDEHQSRIGKDNRVQPGKHYIVAGSLAL
ncbi:uncharacterized protein BDR25DRAFT_302191 [Lindgomyces ingoldianus]|uniref:Uncharacterized protein n=1 Tax=Lindgomyces ingoldianus TaxID=673940 RepID=A0ACB6R365_9PLEO|nr:uncharacterized protein BDR25DRAFT_302191 [Lindgomyces ingoldianus]KAF2473230.1 hypothetical protein BDR25DRAFT_302191 [Lindgomyces ingoldianus]